jgi:hypothetical protein
MCAPNVYEVVRDCWKLRNTDLDSVDGDRNVKAPRNIVSLTQPTRTDSPNHS